MMQFQNQQVQNPIFDPTITQLLSNKGYQIVDCLDKVANSKKFKGKKLNNNQNVTILMIDNQSFYQLACKKEQQETCRQMYVEYFHKMLKNEQYCINSLKHPYIVDQLDIFNDDKYKFVISPYFANDLQAQIAQNQPVGMSEDECIKYMVQIVLGMMSFNQESFVHKYLTPKNVYLDSGKNCLISDLGILSEAFRVEMETAYQAPELLENKQFNYKCDIWSIGVIFYQMLFSSVPFGQQHQVSQAQQQYCASGVIDIEQSLKIDNQQTKFKNLRSSSVDLLKKMLTLDSSQRIDYNQILSHEAVQQNTSQFSFYKGLATFIQDYKPTNLRYNSQGTVDNDSVNQSMLGASNIKAVQIQAENKNQYITCFDFQSYKNVKGEEVSTTIFQQSMVKLNANDMLISQVPNYMVNNNQQVGQSVDKQCLESVNPVENWQSTAVKQQQQQQEQQQQQQQNIQDQMLESTNPQFPFQKIEEPEEQTVQKIQPQQQDITQPIIPRKDAFVIKPTNIDKEAIESIQQACQYVPDQFNNKSGQQQQLTKQVEHVNPKDQSVYTSMRNEYQKQYDQIIDEHKKIDYISHLLQKVDECPVSYLQNKVLTKYALSKAQVFLLTDLLRNMNDQKNPLQFDNYEQFKQTVTFQKAAERINEKIKEIDLQQQYVNLQQQMDIDGKIPYMFNKDQQEQMITKDIEGISFDQFKVGYRLIISQESTKICEYRPDIDEQQKNERMKLGLKLLIAIKINNIFDFQMDGGKLINNNFREIFDLYDAQIQSKSDFWDKFYQYLEDQTRQEDRNKYIFIYNMHFKK